MSAVAPIAIALHPSKKYCDVRISLKQSHALVIVKKSTIWSIQPFHWPLVHLFFFPSFIWTLWNVIFVCALSSWRTIRPPQSPLVWWSSSRYQWWPSHSTVGWSWWLGGAWSRRCLSVWEPEGEDRWNFISLLPHRLSQSVCDIKHFVIVLF